MTEIPIIPTNKKAEITEVDLTFLGEGHINFLLEKIREERKFKIIIVDDTKFIEVGSIHLLIGE